MNNFVVGTTVVYAILIALLVRSNPTKALEVEDDPGPQVVDRKNKPLVAGKSYVITSGSVAGIGAILRNYECPRYVAKQNFVGSGYSPIPVKFRIQSFESLGIPDTDSGRKEIYEGTRVAIRFANPGLDRSCNGQSGWQVIRGQVNGITRDVVRTGGSIENDVFRIVKSDTRSSSGTPVYKLQYCPMLAEVQGCKDVGVVGDAVTKLPFLVVNDDDQNPLLIEFQQTHGVPLLMP